MMSNRRQASYLTNTLFFALRSSAGETKDSAPRMLFFFFFFFKSSSLLGLPYSIAAYLTGKSLTEFTYPGTVCWCYTSTITGHLTAI